MVAIVLGILKIIGILLLVILGLFLFVIISVLFVPLRYRAEGSFYEKLKGSASVSWFLHLISLKISYDEKAQVDVRVLWFHPGQEKAEKAQEKRRKEKENRKKESQKKEKELPVTISEGKVSATEKPEEDLLKEKESEGSYSGESVKDAASHKELSTEKQVKEKTDKSSKRKGSFFKKGKARIKSLKDAKSNLDQFPWREWLELGKNIVIRFFKHVLPQKLRGTITFGCSDPAYTGYVTGIAAVFYPKYGENFSLYPDFERKVFAAQCEGKGRIRLGYILVLVVSILREKSVRTMIKRMILD